MIEPLTRLLMALIVFHVAQVSLIFSGSLRLMLHSVGTRWQKSTQATVGLAEAEAWSSGAKGNATIFREALSPANAPPVSNRRTARPPTMLKASTRHITGPICARCRFRRFAAERLRPKTLAGLDHLP